MFLDPAASSETPRGSGGRLNTTKPTHTRNASESEHLCDTLEILDSMPMFLRSDFRIYSAGLSGVFRVQKIGQERDFFHAKYQPRRPHVAPFRGVSEKGWGTGPEVLPVSRCFRQNRPNWQSRFVLSENDPPMDRTVH